MLYFYGNGTLYYGKMLDFHSKNIGGSRNDLISVEIESISMENYIKIGMIH
jgi:hypothetical protein